MGKSGKIHPPLFEDEDPTRVERPLAPSARSSHPGRIALPDVSAEIDAEATVINLDGPIDSEFDAESTGVTHVYENEPAARKSSPQLEGGVVIHTQLEDHEGPTRIHQGGSGLLSAPNRLMSTDGMSAPGRMRTPKPVVSPSILYSGALLSRETVESMMASVPDLRRDQRLLIWIVVGLVVICVGLGIYYISR